MSDTEPADMGEELADPSEADSDESDDTDGTLQAAADYFGLYPQQLEEAVERHTETLHVVSAGGYEFLVTNPGNGTGYKVDLTREAQSRCTCEDQQYRGNDEKHACKHIQAVARDARSFPVNDPSVAHRLGLMVELMEETADEITKLRAVISSGPPSVEVSLPDADAEPTDAELAEQEPEGQQSAEESDAAETAATRLQEAFDEVIDDMQVTANEGLVWFKTGYDTPEEWPYPGYSETFKAVTHPDMVMYVHDGSAEWADSPHKHFEKKPSEYMKNALAPEAVDEYVAEVLQ